MTFRFFSKNKNHPITHRIQHIINRFDRNEIRKRPKVRHCWHRDGDLNHLNGAFGFLSTTPASRKSNPGISAPEAAPTTHPLMCISHENIATQIFEKPLRTLTRCRRNEWSIYLQWVRGPFRPNQSITIIVHWIQSVKINEGCHGMSDNENSQPGGHSSWPKSVCPTVNHHIS